MKKPLNKRIAAVLSALLLCSFCFLECFPVSAAETENVTHISSAADLFRFSDLCVYDRNSRGKKFVLDCDIDMSGSTFEPVPVFCGIFDGQGYVVSGVKIIRGGDNVGLFRKIENGASVKNLFVEGRIISEGGVCVGGIAGVNCGTITGSSFVGNITAKEKAGGIAGENNGMIASCEASGFIAARHMAGGITGENSGSVISAENYSSVNISPGDETVTLDNFSADNLGLTERTADISDVGGIAGYSRGQIQSSVNRGKIGYDHVGYNIGGIAGRQIGFLSDCENYGDVSGRKDVGGIVGQGEPYVSLFFAEKKLDTLKEQLDALNETLDRTINNAETRYDLSSEDLDRVLSELEGIRSAAGGFSDEAERIINADVDSVNELSSRASELTARLAVISENVSGAADSIKKSINEISVAYDYLDSAMNSAGKGFGELTGVFDELDACAEDLRQASYRTDESLAALKRAIGDPDAMQKALDDLSGSLKGMGHSLKDLSLSAKDCSIRIGDMIVKISEGAEELIGRAEMYLPELREALRELSENAGKLSGSLNSVSGDLEGLRKIIESGSTDPSEYTEYITRILGALSSDSVSGLFDSFADIADAAAKIITEDARSEYDRVVNSYMYDGAGQKLGDSVSGIGNKLENTGKSADGLFSALSDIARVPNVPSFDEMLTSLRRVNQNIEGSERHIHNVIRAFDSASDFFSEGYSSLLAASVVVNHAFYSINAASENVSDAFREIQDAAEYFSSLPEIRFTGADEDIISERKRLESGIALLLEALDSSGDTLDISSDVMAEDLSLINSEARDIYTTLLDMANDLSETSANIEDHTEDISAEDTYGRSDGKISFSKNHGNISGDTCVGGIVGTMGVDVEFDPEGDIRTQGSRSVNFMYRSKTVTRDSVNYGGVTSKYDNCGGIAGLIETGCIISCEAYGYIRSTDGGYVGGAVGKSESSVYSSYAMAHIGGKNYVGGICGYSVNMENSASFVMIDECGEYKGLIAGYSDPEGTLVNNFFADNALFTGERSVGGVDSISLAGKAYPLPYEDFIKRKVPERFKELTLTFKADGKTVYEYNFEYGKAISDGDIPEIPQKSGFFPRWEDFAHDALLFPETINAVYVKHSPAVSSEEKRGETRSLVIAEGAFTDSDTIAVEDIGNKTFLITIPDDGNELRRIRFCTEKKPERTKLFVNNTLTYKENDGSYAVFFVSGNEFTLREETDNSLILIVLASSCAAILIITAAIIRIKRKRKKR